MSPRKPLPEIRTPWWMWVLAAASSAIGLGFLAFVVWAVVRLLDILAAK